MVENSRHYDFKCFTCTVFALMSMFVFIHNIQWEIIAYLITLVAVFIIICMIGSRYTTLSSKFYVTVYLHYNFMHSVCLLGGIISFFYLIATIFWNVLYNVVFKSYS